MLLEVGVYERNIDRGRIELVIKCYPDGLLSGKYLAGLTVGDEVESVSFSQIARISWYMGVMPVPPATMPILRQRPFVIELVIKCYPDGLLSGKYLAGLTVGDEVEFRGPKLPSCRCRSRR
jgi:hypothetical protein